MALFGPKGFAAEVTEGIDLESQITLTGGRITIGNGPQDDLRLGADDIVPEHLTFQQRDDGKWEYFTTGRGETQIDKGNPRTGLLRAGMWFRIGHETKIVLKRADVPIEDGKAGSSQVPLTIAIPALLAMAALALLFVLNNREADGPSNGLQTAAWFTGTADLTPALDACLTHALTPPAYATASAIDGPFWLVMAGAEGAQSARGDLQKAVQNIISETHILSGENRHLEASQVLRRIEYVLPLGTHSCPILSAARIDLALLEMRGTR